MSNVIKFNKYIFIFLTLIDLFFQDFYPVEVQLIHYKSTFSSYASALSSGNAVAVAILSIMMEIQTDDNAKLAKLTNGFDNVRAKDMSSNIGTFPLVDLLPRNTDSFFRFKGSLTYPDCNEVVIWTVFKVSKYYLCFAKFSC